MNSTPQPPSTAGEHFADAERILAALPLVKRGADRDREVQIALVHATLNTMTENSDKSAEMMKFNDEQRDADMQRRISERTPVETDPAAMLTVLVERLLLEHGVDVPAAALAFHVQEMLAAAAAADDQEGAPRV